MTNSTLFFNVIVVYGPNRVEINYYLARLTTLLTTNSVIFFTEITLGVKGFAVRPNLYEKSHAVFDEKKKKIGKERSGKKWNETNRTSSDVYKLQNVPDVQLFNRSVCWRGAEMKIAGGLIDRGKSRFFFCQSGRRCARPF